MAIPGLIGPPIDKGTIFPIPAASVTPPGSDKNVIYNDGGAFAGAPDFTYDKTALTVTAPAGTIALPGLQVGASDVGLAKSATNVLTVGLGLSSNGSLTVTTAVVRLRSLGGLAWASTNNSAGTSDTGFGRQAAAIVEVNTGTLAARRDLVGRTLAADAGVQSGGASAAISTVGAVTYTAAQLLGGGGIIRTGNVAVSDTTPTAAQIVAAMPGAVVGSGCDVWITNNDSGLLTILAGSGVTLAGNTTIAALSARRYRVTVTNATLSSEAVTLTGWGTMLV